MIIAISRRIRSELLLYVANRLVARVPSHRFRLWFYRKVMAYEIGCHSYIFMDAWFDARAGLKIGEHSVVNQRCRLDTRGGINIGNNVSISAEVCLLTADHDPESCDFRGRMRPILIEDNVFIGTRALILPGVTISQGAIVAAGAVVTKNVGPFSIVAGCPARVIGTRTDQLDYTVDYGRLFW